MSNEWYNAVDRELVTCGSTADSFESAAAAVAALINWHVQASLDPAVSAEARALRDTYLAERNALRAEYERLRKESHRQYLVGLTDAAREAARITSNHRDFDGSLRRAAGMIEQGIRKLAALASKEKP